MKITSTLALLALAWPAHAAAHGPHAPAATPAALAREQKPWGIAGDAKAVTRTIEIAMTDDMRFSPGLVEVRQGETIRFVLRNRGKMLHEMVIGTKAELDGHAALMARFPKMEHDEPFMAHVAAGRSGKMVWNFNRAGEFDYACLVAGHYQAGMVGKIRVVPAPKEKRT